jgi:hypothetical protein
MFDEMYASLAGRSTRQLLNQLARLDALPRQPHACGVDDEARLAPDPVPGIGPLQPRVTG